MGCRCSKGAAVKRTLSSDQDEVVTQSSSDVADEEEDVSMLVMRRWIELARLSLLAYEVSETPMFGSSTPGFGLN